MISISRSLLVAALATAASASFAATHSFRSMTREPGGSIRDFGDWSIYRQQDIMSGKTDRLWLFSDTVQATRAGIIFSISCSRGGLYGRIDVPKEPWADAIVWRVDDKPMVAGTAKTTFLTAPNEIIASMLNGKRVAVRVTPPHDAVDNQAIEAVFSLDGFAQGMDAIKKDCAGG